MVDVPSRYDIGSEHNPTGGGTTGLLEEVVGMRKGMEMVNFDYYEGRLEVFKNTLMSAKPGSLVNFFWVYGNRGTGKSQILAHVFQEIISERSDSPPLPIFLSMADESLAARMESASEASASDQIPLELLDEACRDGLKSTFEWLKENKPTQLYPDLMKGMWMSEKGYPELVKYLESDDFSILEFAKKMKSTSLNLVLICDDFDKFSVQATANFLAGNQGVLQDLSSDLGVPIIASVTKQFMEDNRGVQPLDWCLGQHGTREQWEIGAPDIGDLSSSDVQQLIDNRLGYVHKGNVGWTFDAGRKPTNASKVVREWGTYDPTKMRVNGSMLVLFSWMAKTNNRSLRNVLRWINTALNHRPSKKELTSQILTEALTSNYSAETKYLEREFVRRVSESGVSRARLEKEINMIYQISGDPKPWDAMRSITKDMITLNRARGPEISMLNKSTLRVGDRNMGAFIEKSLCDGFRSTSAVYNYLEMVRDLSTDEGYMRSVMSRRPEELFNKENQSNVEKWVEERISKMIEEEFEVEGTATSESRFDAKVEVKEVEDEVEEEAPNEGDSILRGAMKLAHRKFGLPPVNSITRDQSKGLFSAQSEEEQKAFGHELGLSIVRGLYGVGNWKEVSTTLNKEFGENPRMACRRLVTWFARQCSDGEEGEYECVLALSNAMLGNQIWNLLEHESTFQEVIQANRAPRGVHGRELEMRIRELSNSPSFKHNGWKFRISDVRFSPDSPSTAVERKNRAKWKRPDEGFDNLKILSKSITKGITNCEEAITLEFSELEAVSNKSEGDERILDLLGSIGALDLSMSQSSAWLQLNNIRPDPRDHPKVTETGYANPNAFYSILSSHGVASSKGPKIWSKDFGTRYSGIGRDIILSLGDMGDRSFPGFGKLARFLGHTKSWATIEVKVVFKTGKNDAASLFSGLSVGENRPSVFLRDVPNQRKTGAKWARTPENSGGGPHIQIRPGSLALCHPFPTISSLSFEFEDGPLYIPFSFQLAADDTGCHSSAISDMGKVAFEDAVSSAENDAVEAGTAEFRRSKNRPSLRRRPNALYEIDVNSCTLNHCPWCWKCDPGEDHECNSRETENKR